MSKENYFHKIKELPETTKQFGGLVLCLLYTSDAADEEDSVDIGSRRIIEEKKANDQIVFMSNGGFSGIQNKCLNLFENEE